MDTRAKENKKRSRNMQHGMRSGKYRPKKEKMFDRVSVCWNASTLLPLVACGGERVRARHSVAR